ncbi:MAG: fibrillarin-like rRNA/tRNA 2'-O-methyltransferase [Candidatus Nanohaloarchaeota archaeon QJJ-5]|nr:fibrillarin-like rRNA/tRNA 2'-O-methyltransferase [Candidatus Nanohaloarchaeota archaeon QJJ-5]
MYQNDGAFTADGGSMSIESTAELMEEHAGEVYTRNLVPGETVYSEGLHDVDGTEYRRWNPNRSKLGAAIHNGLPRLPLGPETETLYLGAASGTTPSHVSDLSPDGMVYGVEYAPAVIRDLLSLAEKRTNLAPILGDARDPHSYAGLLGRVDVIVQDVAQPDQVSIAAKNAERFLRDDGYVLLAVKARSISSTKSAENVLAEQTEKLEDIFDIMWKSRLEPYEHDHMFYLLQQ